MTMTRPILLAIAVILAILTGWFGANQVSSVWPFTLMASGLLFAVASRQK